MVCCEFESFNYVVEICVMVVVLMMKRNRFFVKKR